MSEQEIKKLAEVTGEGLQDKNVVRAPKQKFEEDKDHDIIPAMHKELLGRISRLIEKAEAKSMADYMDEAGLITEEGMRESNPDEDELLEMWKGYEHNEDVLRKGDYPAQNRKPYQAGKERRYVKPTARPDKPQTPREEGIGPRGGTYYMVTPRDILYPPQMEEKKPAKTPAAPVAPVPPMGEKRPKAEVAAQYPIGLADLIIRDYPKVAEDKEFIELMGVIKRNANRLSHMPKDSKNYNIALSLLKQQRESFARKYDKVISDIAAGRYVRGERPEIVGKPVEARKPSMGIPSIAAQYPSPPPQPVYKPEKKVKVKEPVKPAKKVEVKKPEPPKKVEVKKPPKEKKPKVNLAGLSAILDEKNKKRSVTELVREINARGLSNKNVKNFDDLEDAINNFSLLSKPVAGVSPKDYEAVVSDAFEEVKNTVEAIEAGKKPEKEPELEEEEGPEVEVPPVAAEPIPEEPEYGEIRAEPYIPEGVRPIYWRILDPYQKTAVMTMTNRASLDKVAVNYEDMDGMIKVSKDGKSLTISHNFVRFVSKPADFSVNRRLRDIHIEEALAQAKFRRNKRKFKNEAEREAAAKNEAISHVGKFSKNIMERMSDHERDIWPKFARGVSPMLELEASPEDMEKVLHSEGWVEEKEPEEEKYTAPISDISEKYFTRKIEPQYYNFKDRTREEAAKVAFERIPIEHRQGINGIEYVDTNDSEWIKRFLNDQMYLGNSNTWATDAIDRYKTGKSYGTYSQRGQFIWVNRKAFRGEEEDLHVDHVVTHETAHHYDHYMMDGNTRWAVEDHFQDLKKKISKLDFSGGQPVTRYAAKYDFAGEYFAESYTYYLLHPSILMERDPEMYKILRYRVFKDKEYLDAELPESKRRAQESKEHLVNWLTYMGARETGREPRQGEFEMPEQKAIIKDMDDMEGLKKDIIAKIQSLQERMKEHPEDKKYKTDTQAEILSRVKYFLEKFDQSVVKKSLIENFLLGYKQLAVMGKMYLQLDHLFGVALEVNIQKGFDLKAQSTDDIDKIIFIDAVAHNLHKERIYPILDELADISKAFGEVERNDRMIILADQESARNLDSLNSIKIMNKQLDLEVSSGMWALLEKAIKEGLETLADVELVLLREFLFSRI